MSEETATAQEADTQPTETEASTATEQTTDTTTDTGTDTATAEAEKYLQVQLEGHDPTEIPEQFIDQEKGSLKLESLVKAWKDGQTALRARAPEQYDFKSAIEEVSKGSREGEDAEPGVSLFFENEEQEREVADLFKKHRLSQEAANDFIKLYGSRVQQFVNQVGPQQATAEQQAELSKLESEFGDETPNVFHEVTAYLNTAEGVKEAYQLIRNRRGAQTIKESEVPVVDLEAELGNVISNPSYYNVDSPDYKGLQRKAEQLATQIAKQK